MPKTPEAPLDYERSIFINCPFVKSNRRIFHALIYAAFDCGLKPRCALESMTPVTRGARFSRVGCQPTGPRTWLATRWDCLYVLPELIGEVAGLIDVSGATSVVLIRRD